MVLVVEPIKTDIFRIGEDLQDFIIKNIPGGALQEGEILAITSKICSLSQRRLISAEENKYDLVKREADILLGPVGYGSILTITNGVLILTAGIDESNTPDGSYILYPKDPEKLLAGLYQDLAATFGHRRFGLILTDSRSAPLRHGISGFALACYGFEGVRDKIGAPDLFQRPLKTTRINIADSLAAACVLEMGEAAECQPLCIVRGANVNFTTGPASQNISMPYKEDIYQPLLAALKEKN